MSVCMALVSQTCLGWYEDAVQSGGYGLGIVLFFCLFNMIMLIHSESFGIFLTIKFGQKDWKGMRLVFLRALSFKAFFVVFNFFWLSFTKPVLTLLNFEPKVVDIVSELMFYMIPCLIPVALNIALQTYQVSQKITKPLTYLNIIDIIQMIPLGYIFIWKTGLKLKGYALLRFTIEIVNLIGFLISIKQSMDKRAYQFDEKISEIFSWQHLKDYIKMFWPIFYGMYSSYLAFEICLVIVGNTHDIDFLASYVISLHIMMSIQAFAQGIAQITRTDVIMPISQSQPITGKKYAYLGMIMKLALFLIAGSLIAIFGKQLGEMFTQQPGVLAYLYYMIPLAGLTAIPSALFATIATILRVLKQSTTLARIYIWLGMTIMIGGSYVLQFWTNLFKGYMMWSFFAARFIPCIVGFIIIRNHDWKNIKSK